MPSQQYNQVPASFTPPTTGSGFSFGTDFVPTWLVINNPSSYYLTFPGNPQAIVPPYALGVVIPWGIGPGNIVVSTSYTPPGAPTLPVSNAMVTILATDNDKLGINPGIGIFADTEIPAESNLLVPAGQAGATLTILPPRNATGCICVVVANPDISMPAAGFGISGQNSNAQYGSGSVAQYGTIVAASIVGDTEPIVFEIDGNWDNSGGTETLTAAYITWITGTGVQQVLNDSANPLYVATPPGQSSPLSVFQTVDGPPAVYSATTAYGPGDVVVNAGTVYYCWVATTGNAPPNSSYWITVTLTRSV